MYCRKICNIINNSSRKNKRNACLISTVVVTQNPPDLHKLFVRFSHPKSFNIFRIFDEYERLHTFVSHAIYNIRVRVVSVIQPPTSARVCISDTTRPLVL